MKYTLLPLLTLYPFAAHASEQSYVTLSSISLIGIFVLCLGVAIFGIAFILQSHQLRRIARLEKQK